MITRETLDKYTPDFESGEVILIDKQLYKSSFDIVYKVRKAINIKKVGHAGTLDPMATGLLIVCTGKMTKQIASFRGLEKTYGGVITIGKTTPSFDIETEFDSESDFSSITVDMINETAKSFLGKSFQIPPVYSAVKHKGKSLYQFARKGIQIEKEPREIFISRFDILNIDLPEVRFQITCSTGTYIRVIANDFGKKLGCGAYLSRLRRTGIGQFDVGDSITINEFNEKYKAATLA
ncbi:MAG: tRNA pseudouridine(55) synthase TruB [Melioribacter sp.]|nr:tRNA pseudouridine(55) synthase TruB [Melioribacter sp.]